MDYTVHLYSLMAIQLDDINNKDEIKEELDGYIDELNEYLLYYIDIKNDINIMINRLYKENEKINKIIEINFFNKLFNKILNKKLRCFIDDDKIENYKKKKKYIKSEIKNLNKEKKIKELYIRQIKIDLSRLKVIKKEKLKD